MKVSSKIAKYKIYLDRSRTYVSYVQLLMVMKLFFSDMNVSNKWLVVGVVVCMVGLLFIGYMDTRLGIRQQEMRNNSLHNPVLKDIYDILIKSDGRYK